MRINTKIKQEGSNTWKFGKHHDTLRFTAFVDFGKDRGGARGVAADGCAACHATGMKVAAIKKSD